MTGLGLGRMNISKSPRCVPLTVQLRSAGLGQAGQSFWRSSCSSTLAWCSAPGKGLEVGGLGHLSNRQGQQKGREVGTRPQGHPAMNRLWINPKRVRIRVSSGVSVALSGAARDCAERSRLGTDPSVVHSNLDSSTSARLRLAPSATDPLVSEETLV